MVIQQNGLLDMPVTPWDYQWCITYIKNEKNQKLGFQKNILEGISAILESI